MIFQDNYTTDEKKLKDPDKEKDKTVISNEAFAIGEQIDKLIGVISLRFRK